MTAAKLEPLILVCLVFIAVLLYLIVLVVVVGGGEAMAYDGRLIFIFAEVAVY
jgi:hypothetical protein